MLGFYFAFQVVSRTCFSSSVDLDESEAVMLAQTFSLGYGPEPPLYTWLQRGVFAVLGESILGLSVLKNLLLFCIFSLTLSVARLVCRSPLVAVAACLSLFFLPTIAWESQRDLTHSVLASMLSAATIVALLKAHATRQTRWYLTLGLCAGLGLISKFSFLLWIAGLAVGGLTLPEVRSSILDRRILLSGCLAGAIFLPVGLWMEGHRDLALLSAGKLQVMGGSSATENLTQGLREMLKCFAPVVGALGGVYLAVLFRAPLTAAPRPERAYMSLLLRAWLCIVVGLLVFMVFAGVMDLRERWFQPMLVTLPVYAAALLQSRLSPGRLKWIFAPALAVMTVVAVVFPGRLWVAERLGREEPLTRPYPEIASQLAAVIPPDSLLVCDTKLLAGNLRLGLANARVSTPPLTGLFDTGQRNRFLAWDARHSDDIPQPLRTWASANGLQEVDRLQPRFYSAVYRYHSKKEYRVGLVQAR